MWERYQVLYTLVNNLTNRKIDTPSPESESDEILVNQFADYFMDKITAIRASLEECPMYNPHQTAK